MAMAWLGGVLIVVLAAVAYSVARRRRVVQRREQALQWARDKRLPEALPLLAQALSAEPGRPEILLAQGVALSSLKRYDDALRSFDQLLSADPGHADGHYRRGNVFLQTGRPREALPCYDRALALQPWLADAHYNRGLALQALMQPRDAIASYDRALAQMPDDAEAHNNKGNAFLELRQPQAALDSYRRALALQPAMVDAHYNTGVAWQELKRPHEASESYQRVIELQPDYPHALGRLLHTRMLCCDWRDFQSLCDRLDGQVRQRRLAAEPFGYLASATTSADLRLAAEVYSLEYRQPPDRALWRGERYQHRRIRLAYLSGDFRHQATSLLMVEMFERHDRQQFELVAVDAGWADDSDIRRRIEAAFDEIIDIASLNDDDAAQALRQREIDVLVDLNGYFGQARPGVLARRPCPVQVNYLGFPGTLGTPHVDYLLADAVVIPPDDRRHFSEQVVYLPDSYQANDSTRVVPATPFTRADMGLPNQGFVFCCFNNNFKITPAVFSVWMTLLKQAPGSVLWLLEDNPAVAVNLRREAAAQGVPAERLVFAKRKPLDEHLARHRLADLFLDTLPCNAHTTASDALWTGLPLLTCMGSTFPGRVAASLLRAVGLPELVTHSLDQYQALALELARSPLQMAALKQRLARNLRTTPLYDSARMCRHLDAAYRQMWERAQRGEAPAAFAVAPTDD